ncbi:MAG TPA: hypothetical protein VIO11_00410 [Candidatus Methanoperedens sp.]
MTGIKDFSRRARRPIGDDWDVRFQMSGKLFSEILSFLIEIESDVPFKFYKERIFINMAPYKKSLYTEVEIKKDLLDSYDIKWGKNGDNKRDGDKYKLVIIDLKSMVKEIAKFVKDKKKITIKIDSLITMRAEFIIEDSKMIEELNVWRTLINPKDFNEKRVLELNQKISDLRNGGNKAELILPHEIFERICTLKKKKRYIDIILLFYVNKEGMIMYSGNIVDKGRMLQVLPVDLHVTSIEEYAKVKAQEERKMQYLQESKVVNTGKEGDGRSYKKRDISEPFYVEGNELLALTVEGEQYIEINVKNLAVFTKIKMNDHIIMEIITDHFIYLENHYEGVKFVLVIKAEKEKVEKKIEDYF